MRRLSLLGMALLALGCEAASMRAELLSVDGIGPQAVQPGSRLRVTGAGFPAGRPGSLTFEGTLYRPAAEPSEVRADARGRALSDEIFELRVDEALVSAVGGRGTFEGTVRVAFASAEGIGVVSGAMPDATVDFIGGDVSELAREGRHRMRAEALLDRLGLSLASGAGDEAGLIVDGVAQDGLAALAGVTKGDRIVAIDRVRLLSIADAIPPPGVRSTTLTVARAGEAAPVTIRVPLEGAREVRRDRSWLLAAACAFALGLVVFFLAPTARITGTLACAFGRLPAAAQVRSTKLGSSPRGIVRRAAWAALGILAGILALGVLPLTARVYAGGVDVGILLFISFVARLVLAPPDAARRSRLGRRLAGFVADGLPAAAAAATVVLFSGTLRIAGIVEAQGGTPWEWYALRNPVAFVMFPVFVLAALAAPREPTEGAGVGGVSARMQRYVMAGLATAIFLGGWNLPWVAGDPLAAEPALRLLGTAVFIAKAWALSLVTARIEPPSHRHRWAVPLSLGCVMIASTTLLFPWSAQIERVTGPVLASLAALVCAVAIVRRRRPEPPMPAFPFI